jgi:hypothetical protein
MSDVNAYRAGLDSATLAMVDALRAIVAGAHPGLSERVKWNAPSFALGDEDRITLGIERKGRVRVVLHRGAKAKDAVGFAFADDAGIAKWPAPDRGVVQFAELGEIEARRQALRELFSRWLAVTA